MFWIPMLALTVFTAKDRWEMSWRVELSVLQDRTGLSWHTAVCCGVGLLVQVGLWRSEKQTECIVLPQLFLLLFSGLGLMPESLEDPVFNKVYIQFHILFLICESKAASACLCIALSFSFLGLYDEADKPLKISSRCVVVSLERTIWQPGLHWMVTFSFPVNIPTQLTISS